MPTVSDLIALLQPAEVVGPADAALLRVVQLDGTAPEATDLLWCSDKNVAQLTAISQGTVLVSATAWAQLNALCTPATTVTWLVVDAPRRAFMRVLQTWFVHQPARSISTAAHIHPTVQLGADCAIGHGVVIEEGCTLGAHVTIGHNTVIHAGTVIDNHVSIGANCTIGGVGFGYERNENGTYEVIPHIGNVHICDHAEIGNNTTIDRAVMGSTLIGENVKIDNLVHIAHGVQIGSNSLIIAHAMVAGSVTIGRNVWVAPTAAILQKTTIGDDALIGMGSLVLKDVPANKVVAGAPARILRDNNPEQP